MKRIYVIFTLLVALLCILLHTTSSYAADVQDLSTTVDAPRQSEFVVYTVNLIHTGAATDNVFSQAIDLSGLDFETATVQFISVAGATGRDVNLYLEGSNTAKDTTFESYYTRTEWDDFSPDNGGAEQTYFLNRNIIDTLGVANDNGIVNSTGFVSTGSDTDGTVKTLVFVRKDEAVHCRYIRFKSDGQSGNPATSSTRAVIVFRKKLGFYRNNYNAINVD